MEIFHFFEHSLRKCTRIMSKFLTNLIELFKSNKEDEFNRSIFDYFNQTTKPLQELFDCLIELSKNEDSTNLIKAFLQSFYQWKNQSTKICSIPKFNENIFNTFLLQNLPIESLKMFIEIFQLSKDYLLKLFRSILITNSFTNSTYKRVINFIVELNYQSEFEPNELLLPLILNSKDYLIDLYLNKNPVYEQSLLDLLNNLYEHNGKNLRDILNKKYHCTNVTLNKKSLSKLAVRYWNLYGNEQNEKYPNLAVLQSKRILGYLLNTKYNENSSSEKAMSDECWNELVGVKENDFSLLVYFIVSFVL